jgi:GNAT superfamily N-acetyltransferase
MAPTDAPPPAPRPELIEFDSSWLDELLAMWRESFEAGVGFTDPHPLDEQKQYFLAEVLPRNAVRLAVLDGTVVGFVAASDAAVAQLYVRVGFQRRGIGAQLLTWAKKQSSGNLWLHTFACNTGARLFYERNGFVALEHGFEAMWQLEDVKYYWTRVPA